MAGGRAQPTARSPRSVKPGVGLHLDDFGTGYSSLTALHDFPVETLKIDRSFVAGLLKPEPLSESVIRSAIALAHSRDVPVIAKGIESESQLRRLAELGCDLGQGAFISPALHERALHGSSILQAA